MHEATPNTDEDLDTPPPAAFSQIDPRYIKFRIHTNHGQLVYTDPRLLGKNRFFLTWEQAVNSTYLEKQAPPADTPAGHAKILSALDRTRRRIRDVLLDQSVGGGIGNYLVCEILHQAGIHAARPANTLSEAQKKALLTAISDTFQQASRVESRNWFQVFRRAGQPCNRCNSPIVRESWGKRGNYTCLVCQVPPSGWRLS